MIKVTIAFRVDASNAIGTGHLMEILTLIKDLRKKYNFDPLIITTNNSFSKEKLKSISIQNIKYLPEGLPEQKEVEQIVSLLRYAQCEHIVIDLLDRSNDYYNYLHRALKTSCVILDNAEHKEIPATLVVNFSICQNPSFYQKLANSTATYLVGPQYFLFDEEIKKISFRNNLKNVEKIFINQGGSDPYGLTVKILRAIDKAYLNQEINVIMGGFVQKSHQELIAKLKTSLRGNYRFFADIPRDEMYKLMQESDLAVSAAGNTLYELLFLGVPTIVISHHELHDEVAQAFERRGAVINLGIGNCLTESVIEENIRRLIIDDSLRMALSRNARNTFIKQKGDSLADELINNIRLLELSNGN